MRKNRPLPRATLAKNLRYLMDMHNLTEAAAGERAGVSQKTINKILNQDTSTTLDILDKVSAAFNLNIWHLIIPDLPDELLRNGSLEHLVDHYVRTSQEGRQYIDRVAEHESIYHPNPMPPASPPSGNRKKTG